ncbi:DUF3006 domain-containing protein [Desulfotomaculum copahuensis]|uniref:Uncharacterized protein n=1 Tax=Desulfotomaculum copahuensis TaxID=1838280 RepID=A0A1B7LG03_9FIRM|nr:DUF3006 domain-containing protein [Desulfotomaculum copahuensis]OAT83672.1 hypothetical protein A6M21_07495 [Desulfotomaculum copahuensis]
MLIIDRFEGSWAVVEFNQETFNIPKPLIPNDAREGDVIKINITVDKKATADRAEAIKRQADDLFED